MVDLPQDNLWCGQVGTVVEILAEGTAFEVEFSDRNGRTYESLGLRPDQIIVIGSFFFFLTHATREKTSSNRMAS